MLRDDTMHNEAEIEGAESIKKCGNQAKTKIRQDNKQQPITYYVCHPVYNTLFYLCIVGTNSYFAIYDDDGQNQNHTNNKAADAATGSIVVLPNTHNNTRVFLVRSFDTND